MQKHLSFRAARNLLLGNEKLQRLQNRPKTRRGGCPHPPGGAKLRKLVFMQDQASCARTKRPGLRQHQNTSEARNLLLSSGRIDCSPLTRSAMTNCRGFRIGQKHVGAGALTRPAERSSANWYLCKTRRAAPGRSVRAYVSIKTRAKREICF